MTYGASPCPHLEVVRKAPEAEDLQGAAVPPADRERAWLKRQRGEEVENSAHRPQKLHRVASRNCVLRWDNSLQSLGLSMNRFQLPKPDEDRGDPFEWPWLAMCLDRAGPNCTAAAYLQRMAHVNLFDIWDINHSSWNSETQSIKDCGMMPWLLLMLVSVNLLEGPYSSSARYRESIERLQVLWATTSGRDMPAFMQALPDIAAELGMDEADDGLAEAAWQRLRDSGPMKARGYRCNLNRFYGFVVEGAKALDQYAQRAYLFLHVALEADYLAGVPKLKIRGGGPQASSSSTSVIGPDERAIRDMCGNAYTITTMMYADISNKMKLGIVVVAGRHNKAWQGRSNKELRGVGATAPWLRRQLSGGFQDTMRSIADEVSSEEAAQQIGFVIPAKGSKAVWDAGEIEWQDQFARLFFKYVFTLISNRTLAELWWLMGWTTKSVFFSEDSDRSRGIAQQIKRSFQDFEKFEEQAQARKIGCKSIVNRSLFMTPHLQQVVAMLQSTNFSITPRLQQWSLGRWRILMHSQLVEDGFNREKIAARKSQVHRLGREQLAHFALLESGVFAVHKLEQLEPRTEDVGRSEVVDDRFFQPRISEMSIEVPNLVSHSQSPPWYSPQGPRLHLGYADIPMMREIVRENNFEALRTMWLGALLNISHMMIVQKVVGNVGVGSWCLPLQHCTDSGVLVWPVQLTRAGQSEVLEWRNDNAEPIFIQVFELESWQGRHIEAVSPMGQFANKYADFRSVGFGCVRVAVATPARGLLRCAAEKGFWRLPVTFLRKLSEHIGVHHHSGSSTFEILFRLVQHCGEFDEDPALDIIADRLGSGTGDGADFGYDDILELDEAAACLDPNDKQDVADCKKKAMQKAAEHKDVVNEWIRKSVKIRKKIEKAMKKQSGGKRGAAASSSSSSRLSLPSCSLEQVSLVPFCPSGGYIWKGNKARNWNGHYKPFARMSCAWSVYGMRGSAIRILRYLWECHAKTMNLKMPDDCPVQNLFNDDAPVPHV